MHIVTHFVKTLSQHIQRSAFFSLLDLELLLRRHRLAKDGRRTGYNLFP